MIISVKCATQIKPNWTLNTWYISKKGTLCQTLSLFYFILLLLKYRNHFISFFFLQTSSLYVLLQLETDTFYLHLYKLNLLSMQFDILLSFARSQPKSISSAVWLESDQHRTKQIQCFCSFQKLLFIVQYISFFV